MKKSIQVIVISLLALLNYGNANADAINLSLVDTTYDYSFPANVFLDDNSMGFGLTYSFHLDPTWSIDLGYTDHGSATRNIFGINTEVETISYSLAFRGSMMVGTLAGHNINIHGLAGVSMADMDITAGGSSLSDSDTGLLLGVGSSLMISSVDELTLMYKMADLDFNDTVNFEYNPTTIELGYSRRF